MSSNLNAISNRLETTNSSELAEKFKRLALTVVGAAVVGSVGAAFAGSVGLVIGAGLGGYLTWKALGRK